MKSTSSKTVLVTGGSRGIGFAIAQSLLRKGFRVHICARDEQELREAVKTLSRDGGVTASVLDLSDAAAIGAFCQVWQGSLYGIVHNAGICKTARVTDASSDVWDQVLAVNLQAVQLLTTGLVKHLEDEGRIVAISSQLGKEGRAGYGAYCASKFGLIGLVKCWAKELGERGITVNAVCPGWVETDMSVKDVERLAKEKGVTYEALYKEICAPLELKRFTKPEEVASLVAFLVSEEGSGVTGRDWLLNTIWNQE